MPAIEGAVLGVNFAAGVAYLAVVGDNGKPISSGVPKIAPPTNAVDWIGLRQFGERLVAEARAHKVSQVVVALPRRAANWVYSEAYTRASLHVAAGLALDAEGVPLRAFSQRTIAAKLGFSGIAEMDHDLAARFSLAPGAIVHWKDRAVAFAAAFAGTRGVGP